MKDNKLLLRLSSILRHIDSIQKDLCGITFDVFNQSDLLIRATSFSIVQIGESMNKVEELVKNNYPNVPWKKAKAMRNLIVHDYENVDPQIVYCTATSDLEELRVAILGIYNDLDKK